MKGGASGATEIVQYLRECTSGEEEDFNPILHTDYYSNQNFDALAPVRTNIPFHQYWAYIGRSSYLCAVSVFIPTARRL